MQALALRPPATTTYRVLLLAFFASLIVGCANSPVAVAETPAQKFYAVKLTYDAVLGGALTLVNDPNVSADVKRAIQSAAAASGDVYREANRAYIAYVAARGELAAGQTTSDKLRIATANLERWLNDLDATAGRLAALANR